MASTHYCLPRYERGVIMTKSSEEIKKAFWDFSEEAEAERRKINPEEKWFKEFFNKKLNKISG